MLQCNTQRFARWIRPIPTSKVALIYVNLMQIRCKFMQLLLALFWFREAFFRLFRILALVSARFGSSTPSLAMAFTFLGFLHDPCRSLSILGGFVGGFLQDFWWQRSKVKRLCFGSVHVLGPPRDPWPILRGSCGDPFEKPGPDNPTRIGLWSTFKVLQQSMLGGP